MAFRDQPLGELALTIPRASALFRQYDMGLLLRRQTDPWRGPHRAKRWMSR
ncbi:nitric oxide-dependent regulator DnrN or NorA [Klebsiella pneumoniae]|uniref:Nitric oxide-dependent regulator DnrN or NorA n=1 Tax=Klebsiella pneumoniae TaxID=573 RepID=A0A377WB52_KLEPN|nr:nitric oxide-dependent regulator DnrN or NorA [Klebsiella pneumoniae]